MKVVPGKRLIAIIAGSTVLVAAVSALLWRQEVADKREALQRGSRVSAQKKTGRREIGNGPNGVAIGSIHPAFTQDLAQQQNGSGMAIKAGMTQAEVLAIIGSPKKRSATTMKSGIYGVPSDVENKIGHGNAFEMWEYEQWSPELTIYTTVFYYPSMPEEPEGLRVTAVKRQVVTRSVKFRILKTVEGALRKMGVDLD